MLVEVSVKAVHVAFRANRQMTATEASLVEGCRPTVEQEGVAEVYRLPHSLCPGGLCFTSRQFIGGAITA